MEPPNTQQLVNKKQKTTSNKQEKTRKTKEEKKKKKQKEATHFTRKVKFFGILLITHKTFSKILFFDSSKLLHLQWVAFFSLSLF